MGIQNGIVWFDDSRCYLGCRINGKGQLGFLPIFNGKSFHQKGGKSRSGATTKGMEQDEALEASAIFSQPPDFVHAGLDHFSADGVVTSGIIVSSILLTGAKLIRVEQLPVCPHSNLI